MLRCLCLLACLLPTLALAQSNDAWDVNAPFAPTKPVQFTTNEGTWMTVDVSPDGQTLVFDLLGDLYTLPITGGTATRLTSGPAYDIQPQWSPDGTQIAFTSDRAGGDNLWVMDADGSNATQVTNERFRLVNGPAWTPDGQYLLGRKHFTATRSLGAGEVWMYHSSGGSGLQLTKRRNDQQDQGNEITVSPDGRYVYFSEDATSGSTFQYNKDPNPGIYRIRRLDRETGEVETVISGPGGAARPVLSPDGERLAFVRRVRGESVLYEYELSSGIARALFDGLDRDQQEAWAIFGVYPNFSYTPDGENLVFWAQGQLWTMGVDNRELTNIPFTVNVDLVVTEAIRFPFSVHEDRFDAKMLTDATTSPDGETVVVHAVGKLWTTKMSSSTVQRLTQDADRFEYAPSFSPDGTQLVYMTWSDEDLGQLHVMDVASGATRTLPTEKGYVYEPRFSPDGSKIVYRRSGGTSLLGTAFGQKRGLFWTPSAGGEEYAIRPGGRDARFTPDGERITFLTGGGLNKQLRSCNLDGGEERTHFTMKYPSDVVPSPDGNWVAFTDLFNVYITPFPKTGSPVELAKEMRSLPVKQVTRDAGTSLHWSAGSEALHWLIGPDYFTQKLSDTFAFVEGAPDELPAMDTTGTRINLSMASDMPTSAVAFTNARIVTMDGDEVIEGGTLVVEGNRIVAIGTDVAVPEGAHVVNASGHTILPGLIDAHAHASHFASGPTPQQNWVYLANLAYGVTTMHDPSANTEFVFRQSELQKAGAIVAPRIYSTGTILYGADGDFKATVNSLDDARSHLRRLKAVGAISVKSYNQPRREQRQQILRAAHELEMLVVPEGGSTFVHNLTQIIDGHTGLEHNLPVAPLYRDVLELWRHTEVGYTPTLGVNFGGPSGEYYWYQHTDVWAKERLLTFYPRGTVDARARRPIEVPDEEYHHITVAEQTAKLVRQGNTVQIGGHGQLQGLAAHWEFWMFEQGGMTPHEALRSATLHGAQHLGLDGDIGSLEVGKLADLIVIDGNPLADLSHTENVAFTMLNGRLYDAATMNQVGNHPDERAPLWWERHGADDRFVWLPTHNATLPGGHVCTCGRH